MVEDGDPTRAQSRAPRVVLKFTFRVVDGPDAGTELEYDTNRPRLLVGQSPACDVRLTDPAVSRRHFALDTVGNRVRLTDLESTNGTFVGQLRIGQAFLSGGEIIRIGETTIEAHASFEKAAPQREDPFAAALGRSAAMQRLYPLCRALAESNVPVILEGETGTGKEHLARVLHAAGPRAAAPFVVFDCAAVAGNLIESELFGHERGAFTGAVGARQGVFERAHGGTLLIDEIGDLPLHLQPRLLRVVEQAEVTRVGGNKPTAVSVRILSATRRDLDREVLAGNFRDDLFHRLAVTRIELPPLRERIDDLEHLVHGFLAELGAEAAAIPRAVLEQWSRYGWPGNVRELKNAVARRVALGHLDDASLDETEKKTQARGAELMSRGDTVARILTMGLPYAEARRLLLDEFDTRYAEYMLEQNGGSATRAAAAAGVARRHFYRLKNKT